jgi:hypothetical protein
MELCSGGEYGIERPNIAVVHQIKVFLQRATHLVDQGSIHLFLQWLAKMFRARLYKCSARSIHQQAHV